MDDPRPEGEQAPASEEHETEVTTPAPFWAAWPWRSVVGALAAVAAAGLAVAAFVLPRELQYAAARFVIPIYSYACIGFGVLALTELREPFGRRVVMAIALIVMAAASVLSYAAGAPPALILGLHLGFLIAWVAWPRRFGWTLLALAEVLAWIGLAVLQGRLP